MWFPFICFKLNASRYGVTGTFFAYILMLTLKTVYIVLCLFLLASVRSLRFANFYTPIFFNTPNLSRITRKLLSIRLSPWFCNTIFFNKLNISSISADSIDVLFAHPQFTVILNIFIYAGKTHRSHTPQLTQNTCTHTHF